MQNRICPYCGYGRNYSNSSRCQKCGRSLKSSAKVLRGLGYGFSMGTHSYVLAGTKKAADETFSSVCHGAGRVMSRTQAQKTVAGRQLINDLAANGIAVRTDYLNSLAEEAPHAYKDVDCVVAVCENAGIARRVARLKPLGVIKG